LQTSVLVTPDAIFPLMLFFSPCLFLLPPTCCRFAIKTQLCPKESEFHSVLKEVRALRWNRHPCIIDLHDAFLMLNPRYDARVLRCV
jgi:hypothetical protein